MINIGAERVPFNVRSCSMNFVGDKMLLQWRRNEKRK
jgi:hypothetical protein